MCKHTRANTLVQTHSWFNSYALVHIFYYRDKTQVQMFYFLNKILIYKRKWFHPFISSQTRSKHHNYQATIIMWPCAYKNSLKKSKTHVKYVERCWQWCDSYSHVSVCYSPKLTMSMSIFQLLLLNFVWKSGDVTIHVY